MRSSANRSGVRVTSITAPSPSTVGAEVAAARAAAGDSWLILYSELCGAAMGAGGRASSAPPTPGGAGRGRHLIADAMPKVGLDPTQIKYVVVTHGHGDHSAARGFYRIATARQF